MARSLVVSDFNLPHMVKYFKEFLVVIAYVIACTYIIACIDEQVCAICIFADI